MKCRGLALLAVFSLVLLAGCGRHDRSPTAATEDESKNSQTLGVIKGHLDFEAAQSPSSAPRLDAPQLKEVKVYAESIETSDTYPGEPVEDNGDYIIKRLPAGKYKVIARTENGIYGGILTEGDGTLEAEVAAGKTKEIQQPLILSTKGRISGRVVLVGPDGKRLPETGFMEVFIPGKSFGSCWTTRKGEFTFYYIPAGRYPIVADYKGDKVTIVEDVEVKLGRETPLGEILMHSRELGGAVFGVVTASWSPPWLKANSFPCSPPPEFTSTDRTMPVALKPIPGAKVRVYPRSIPGRSEFQGEFPMGTAAISIHSGDEEDMEGGGNNRQPSFETITDENGKYRIKDIPAGDYYVAVSAEGFEGQEMAIIIEPDKELHLDFSLVSKPTASIYGQAVEGKEDDASNYGLPGVEIALEILWGTERFTTATDRSGRYRIDGIPGWPGGVGIPLNCLVPYAVLTASKPGYKSQKIEIFDPLKPGEQREINFTLLPVGEKTASIYGVVTYAGMEMPIPEADVTVTLFTGETFTTRTDGSGNYRIDGLPASDVIILIYPPPAIGTVTASRTGYGSRTVELPALASGEERKINLWLAPVKTTASIYGVVLDGLVDCAEGADCLVPISSVLIEVLVGKTRLTAITDEKGRYRVDGIPAQSPANSRLPEEDTLIIVSKNGYKPQTYNLSPPLIYVEEKEMNFYLMPELGKGSVLGKVMAGESPLQGVRVTAIPKVGIYQPQGNKPEATKANCVIDWSDITDEKGEYRIDNLPVNDYLIIAETEGYKRQEKEATIEAGKKVTVDFDLELIELKLNLAVDTGLPAGVGLVLSVTNPASVPVTIFFSSGHTHDFSIYDASGELVWEWSYGKVFIMIALPKTFKPGETMVYKGIWDGRSNEGEVVPAGRYAVIGRLASKPAWKTEPVEFDFEPGQGPQLTYSNSGCLSNRGEPVKAKDEIIAKVEGNEVYVTHRNAWYNCCLEEIRVELEQEGNQFKLIETAILEGSGCRCMCLYDVLAAISDLAAGEYIIQVWNEDQGLLGEITVIVP
ncbi:MAG: carboxypeptidase regulatory-like domain-containing protein [bacterium]|nr:carboxypeptidase regulatory-like domain-containing protein [bacterium]